MQSTPTHHQITAYRFSFVFYTLPFLTVPLDSSSHCCFCSCDVHSPLYLLCISTSLVSVPIIIWDTQTSARTRSSLKFEVIYCVLRVVSICYKCIIPPCTLATPYVRRYLPHRQTSRPPGTPRTAPKTAQRIPEEKDRSRQRISASCVCMRTWKPPQPNLASPIFSATETRPGLICMAQLHGQLPNLSHSTIFILPPCLDSSRLAGSTTLFPTTHHRPHTTHHSHDLCFRFRLRLQLSTFSAFDSTPHRSLLSTQRSPFERVLIRLFCSFPCPCPLRAKRVFFE